MRLSPAASLLRNSKLFALPPPIALPAAPPSSDQVAASDTATTVYPRYAAIETTTISGSRGDWGFKRPLPLKTTKTTSNPVVRLVRGIDTPEHVADFESAADHALTLRKFQELHIPIQHEAKEQTGGYRNDVIKVHRSVFRSTHDNTSAAPSSRVEANSSTGIWPEIGSQDVFNQLPDQLKQIQAQVDEREKASQDDRLDQSGNRALEAATKTRVPPQLHKRWRYSGPSLIQMSGMEFSDYIHSLGQKERDLLIDKIKKIMVHRRKERARDKGEGLEGITEESITPEDIAKYMRYLRNSPSKFGPILAEMLDLPEGPSKAWKAENEPWEYGRMTLATEAWTVKGPPKTHPSAGLSYLRSAAFAHNHPVLGPQKSSLPVVARAVKTRSKPAGGNDVDYGVAGFIVPKPDMGAVRASENFTPCPGGIKTILRPGAAMIKEDGSLLMLTSRVTGYNIRDDKPVSDHEIQQERLAELNREAQPAPKMSADSQSSGSRGDAAKREQERVERQEQEDALRMLNERVL